jgi:hypothetical protein
MNASKPNSAPKSAKTSPNAPAKPGPSKAAKVTEAEYLDAQAARAQAAMGATLHEMKNDVARGLSPLELARRYPLLTLLGSAIGGFAAAAALVPSKEQQALDRLRRMHEALHPEPKAAPTENGNKPQNKHGSFASLLVHELIGLIRPIIASLLSAAMTARPNRPEQSSQSPPDAAAPTDAGVDPPV